MSVSEKYNNKCPISFEIFPPKGELDPATIGNVLDGMSRLSPDFISVTYSAGGGGNSQKTIEYNDAGRFPAAALFEEWKLG